jgi:hypothetical protein
MQIEVYILANNEEKLMPYLMRHYTQFAKVIIIESNSTDRTVEIAKSLGAEVRSFEMKDEINDQWFTNIKNNCWKDSKADWIMIVDADEFIYHPDIKNKLETTTATIFLPSFYNMYSETFPTTTGQIYEEVQYGSLWGGKDHLFGKSNIFKLPDIEEMNFNIGCHNIKPVGNVKLEITDEIKTLHMRNLSKEFVIERNVRTRSRLSELNKKHGWGGHLNRSVAEMSMRLDEEMKGLIKVI